MSFFSRIRRVLAAILAVIALVLLVCAAIAMLSLGPQMLPAVIESVQWGYFLAAAFVFGSLAVMADPEEAMRIIGRAFDAAGRLSASVINRVFTIAEQVTSSAGKLLLTNPIFLAIGGALIFKWMSKRGDDAIQE